MPNRLWLLRALRHKVELDSDLKFAPARFFDFKWRSFDHTKAIGVGIVELELDSLEPVGYIFVVDTADEDFPRVRMISWCILGPVCWIEGNGFCPIDEGTVDLHALILSASSEISRVPRLNLPAHAWFLQEPASQFRTMTTENNCTARDFIKDGEMMFAHYSVHTRISANKANMWPKLLSDVKICLDREIS
jgi:hypothetical protein